MIFCHFAGRNVQKLVEEVSVKRVVNVSNKIRAEVLRTLATDLSKSSKNATIKSVLNGVRGPIGLPAQSLVPEDNGDDSGNV